MRGDVTTVRLPLVARRLRYTFVAVVAAVVLVSSISRPGATGTVTSPFGLVGADKWLYAFVYAALAAAIAYASVAVRSEEHTSVLQSHYSISWSPTI